MCKYTETFNANTGYKATIVVFIPFSKHKFVFVPFSKYKCFQTLFARKRGLAQSYFLYENESF